MLSFSSPAVLRSAPLWVALALLSSSTIAVRSATAETQSAADRHIARAATLFSNGDDAAAAALCRQAIAESPDSTAAALGHLYLGLIAFNVMDRRLVLREFEASIRVDPFIELPILASPKAQILFSQARQHVLQSREQSGVPAANAPPPRESPRPAQPPPMASPPLASSPHAVQLVPLEPQSEATQSFVPAIACLAGAAAIAAVGIGFGVASHQAADAESATPYRVVAVSQGNAEANNGRIADVAFAAAGAAGIAGLVLLTIELTSRHSDSAIASGTAGFPLRAQF